MIKVWKPFIHSILKLQNVIHQLPPVFGLLLNLLELFHQSLILKENSIAKLDLIPLCHKLIVNLIVQMIEEWEFFQTLKWKTQPLQQQVTYSKFTEFNNQTLGLLVIKASISQFNHQEILFTKLWLMIKILELLHQLF